MYPKGPTMHHTMGLFGGQRSSKQVYSHWAGCLRGLGVSPLASKVKAQILLWAKSLLTSHISLGPSL